MSEDQNIPQQQVDNRQLHWFKPGQSGNPGGRPKGSQTYNGIIRKFGSRKLQDIIDILPSSLKVKIEPYTKLDPEITVKEAIVISSTVKALSGDAFSRDFLADREEGKAPQTITLKEEKVIIDIDESDTDENINETDNTNPDTDNGTI